jgi:hypothetical protein
MVHRVYAARAFARPSIARQPSHRLAVTNFADRRLARFCNPHSPKKRGSGFSAGAVSLSCCGPSLALSVAPCALGLSPRLVLIAAINRMLPRDDLVHEPAF